jgi:hypothetical protein
MSLILHYLLVDYHVHLVVKERLEENGGISTTVLRSKKEKFSNYHLPNLGPIPA